jgi:hypothetical protein
MRSLLFRTTCTLTLLCALSGHASAQLPAPSAQADTVDGEFPPERLLQPAELAQILSSTSGEKPRIGSRTNFFFTSGRLRGKT